MSPAEEGERGQEGDWDIEGMWWSWDDTGQSGGRAERWRPSVYTCFQPLPQLLR